MSTGRPAAAELRAAALRYAAAGWPVFPTEPDDPGCEHPPRCRCKAPMRHTRGFKDATTDPVQIRAWWSRWPAANVAIATGAPGPDVLDVDVRADGSGFPALRRLKQAGLLTGASALVRTTRAGLHVYMAGTDQGCHAAERHHLDFRSRGGYVIAPPSRVGGKPYELLDHRPGTATLDWSAVLALLDPPARPRRPVATVPWQGGDLPQAVQRALDAPAPDRSAALHRLVGACLRARMDEAAIQEIAAGYEPAREKYGPRLAAEVTRSMTRIGACE